MGLLCEFDVCADFGFIDSTPEFGIVPDYSEGCEVFCQVFIEASRRMVPVDTGYLRSTLDAYYNDTFCTAETICEYAQYVEYGTWKQAAQPYFVPALEEALGAAVGLWESAQEEAMMEEEELILQAQEEAMEEMSSMGIGSTIGATLGGMLAGLITTFIYELVGFAFYDKEGTYSSSSGGYIGGGAIGEGSAFLPDIIIT